MNFVVPAAPVAQLRTEVGQPFRAAAFRSLVNIGKDKSITELIPLNYTRSSTYFFPMWPNLNVARAHFRAHGAGDGATA
ncbi:hypothetical protein EVAR_47502_1 [Eumeta japonica]|uniref:Uncharacterized protein n=1 Tax=Eumeta variegata TaxID=151549 RepID=A0A4C1XSM0_EUMVA|nr:hypothetical protein EVAR_47502_1 [Eumeta japonica]